MQFIGGSRSASLFSLEIPVMLPSTVFLTFDQGQKKAEFGDQLCEIAAGMAMKNGSNVFPGQPSAVRIGCSARCRVDVRLRRPPARGMNRAIVSHGK
jgi:hypothetical protein